MTSRLKMIYILKCFGNYFKIALNKLIYKMALLPLPRGSGRDMTNVVSFEEPPQFVFLRDSSTSNMDSVDS